MGNNKMTGAKLQKRRLKMWKENDDDDNCLDEDSDNTSNSNNVISNGQQSQTRYSRHTTSYNPFYNNRNRQYAASPSPSTDSSISAKKPRFLSISELKDGL